MHDQDKSNIYGQLAEFQQCKECDTHELYAELHRFAQLFIDEFRLNVVQFVVGIGHLSKRRLGQYRYGRNDLGLKAEILIADHHVRVASQMEKSGAFSARCCTNWSTPGKKCTASPENETTTIASFDARLRSSG